MIKQQLRTGDVLSEPILDLYHEIPRAHFVPSTYQPFAYSDLQIHLAHQQRMMTPLEEGKILQALNLKGHELVLEIGTGTGFLTALLSRLCKKVISVDYYEEFTKQARQKLQDHHCNNVELFTGDARHGWVDKAPYDVIVYTAAIPHLTETERLQVVPGGKAFVIVGQNPAMQGQLHHLHDNGLWTHEVIFETCLPEMINLHPHHEFIF